MTRTVLSRWNHRSSKSDLKLREFTENETQIAYTCVCVEGVGGRVCPTPRRKAPLVSERSIAARRAAALGSALPPVAEKTGSAASNSKAAGNVPLIRSDYCDSRWVFESRWRRCLWTIESVLE